MLKKLTCKTFVVLFISFQLLFCICFILRIDKKGINNSNEVIEFSGNAIEEIANGKLGYKYNEWYSNNFPFRDSVMRLYNQWKYEIFNEIANGWIIGKNGWMYNAADSQKWVLCDSYNSTEELDVYAQKVAVIQDYLQKNNKEFIYILTPMKAAIYPEYLPSNYNNITAENVSDYEKMKIAFDKAGVKYYDPYEDLQYLKENASTVFYKTGHHWTVEACSFVVNNIFKELNMEGNVELPQITIKSLNPTERDKDKDILLLSDLLNYKYTEKYSFPIFNYTETLGENSIFLYGTSNGEQIFESLVNGENGKCAVKQMFYHHYFTALTTLDANGLNQISFQENTELDNYNFLREIESSNIIIMEQSANVGILDTHIKFVDYLIEHFLGEYKYTQNLMSDIEQNDTNQYSGWGECENFGRWTMQKEASVRIYMNQMDKEKRYLVGELQYCNGERKITLFVNDIRVGELLINNESSSFSFEIPKEVKLNGFVEIRVIDEGEFTSPSEISDSQDTRKLGLGFAHLSID